MVDNELNGSPVINGTIDLVSNDVAPGDNSSFEIKETRPWSLRPAWPSHPRWVEPPSGMNVALAVVPYRDWHEWGHGFLPEARVGGAATMQFGGDAENRSKLPCVSKDDIKGFNAARNVRGCITSFWRKGGAALHMNRPVAAIDINREVRAQTQRPDSLRKRKHLRGLRTGYAHEAVE